jgi:excinuclease ABC subunit C
VRFCSAPCIGKVSREGYRERFEEACAFLRGERPAVLKEIEQRMNAAAEAHRFEDAAALRDTLLLLRAAVRERARVAPSPELRARDARAGIAALARHLGLERPPRVIEAFDISNISGTLAVAGMVCAVDGLPRRNRYRRFRLRTIEGSDDPGMMAEAVTRRYGRLREEQGTLPDLVLVDGGIAQMRAARAALAAFEPPVRVPCAGLAKRFEEIHWADPGAPIRLPRDSGALQVLQRLRDEAHRFALTYHRTLRARRIRESALDDVPGIGAKRKQQLLEHFGSLRRLRRASVDEIAGVPGFGVPTARALHAALAAGDGEDNDA